ncbi:MAG TPA: type 1 glutamine amidotransferase [Bacteroidetes bacterium]|nr:type 1 glutamine amidotransferase [Bacteroidota bacterium]
MKIQIIQHVDFEGPGAVLDWAREREVSVGISRILLGEPPPSLQETDGLVVMGGPINLSSPQKDPLLEKEKTFLKEFLSSGKKILGICLGAQLLAQLLGARVFRNSEKEIGWFPIQKNAFAKHPLLDLYAENTLPAFHWHGDTFSLPEGGVPLFSSEATRLQAFVWNNQVFALQFHWEVKPENVRMLLENTADDLAGEHPFVQAPQIMTADDSLFSDSQKNLYRLLDFIFTEEK